MTVDRFTLHYLLHSAELLEDHLRRRLSLIGMRPRQARMLDALSRIEPASQVSLARTFRITAASMSTMTARLIEAGLIEREANPKEARSNVLRLTKRGRGMIKEIHEAWDDIDALIAEQLGATDTKEFARINKKLRDSLGGHPPGSETPTGDA